MKKCNFCNVNIKDETDHCPLCGGVLDGEEIGENTYPNVLKKEKSISFIFRLMLFITLIASAASITTNIATGVSIAWSLIVTFSLLYVLLILHMFVKENAGYRVRVFGIASFGVALIILIDYVLGFKRWSVNFVLPSVIIYVTATFLLLMLINRRNWQSYTIIHMLITIISIIPLIMYRIGIVTNPVVSIVAFGISFVVTLGILILGGPRVKSEMYRRFHIFGK